MTNVTLIKPPPQMRQRLFSFSPHPENSRERGGSETSHWALLWYSKLVSFQPHPRDQRKMEAPKRWERIFSQLRSCMLCGVMCSWWNICITWWWQQTWPPDEVRFVFTVISWVSQLCTSSVICFMLGAQTLWTSWCGDAHPKGEGCKSAMSTEPSSTSPFSLFMGQNVHQICSGFGWNLTLSSTSDCEF